MKRLVVLALLASATTAAAEDRCRDLAPHLTAKFAGPAWKRTPAWSRLEFTVVLDRAPHLARTILADCPGVTITKLVALDARHFSTAVRVKLTGADALARLTQLPAVRAVHHYVDKGMPEGAPRFPLALDR